MKIQNSSISMAATHQESSYSYKETATMEVAKSKDAVGAILTLSQTASGKNVRESMLEYQKQQEDEQKKRQQLNMARTVSEMARLYRTKKSDNQLEDSDDVDMKIKMLRQILAALRGEKTPENCKSDSGKHGNDRVLDLRSDKYREAESSSFSFDSEKAVSLGTFSLGRIGTTSSGSVWQRVTASTEHYTESEMTTFASKGIVQTADGRSIGFNVEIAMSRAFTCQIDRLDAQEFIKTDPLVINLDSNIASVSDQKFYFDLDTDGKEEEISFAGKGSGFLALDKNGDGKINDGSELFGTKSGDGFKDLAAYDEDGNGWIDENDSIFSKLKVWTKDKDGSDKLLDLKSADVGAIYLSNVDTQFSLKDDSNRLDAEIKKTGIFLRESTGMVGTLNHVDLAV